MPLLVSAIPRAELAAAASTAVTSPRGLGASDLVAVDRSASGPAPAVDAVECGAAAVFADAATFAGARPLPRSAGVADGAVIGAFFAPSIASRSTVLVAPVGAAAAVACDALAFAGAGPLPRSADVARGAVIGVFFVPLIVSRSTVLVAPVGVAAAVPGDAVVFAAAEPPPRSAGVIGEPAVVAFGGPSLDRWPTVVGVPAWTDAVLAAELGDVLRIVDTVASATAFWLGTALGAGRPAAVPVAEAAVDEGAVPSGGVATLLTGRAAAIAGSAR